MAKHTDNSILMTLKPAQTAEAISRMSKTTRALFIWGPPGIAKSAVAQGVATEKGIAFIDLRLSQIEPTDLRGIPFPVNVGGVDVIVWAPPLTLPQKLNIVNVTVDIDEVERVIFFNNPIGSNKIHYCTDPQINVVSLTPGARVEIVEQSLDQFTVILRNEAGEPVAGKISYSVKGDPKGILGLEEFNSAGQSVQAASYQLILDRRLGEYIVPDGVYIMAMGNRETDKGITFTMPSPVANRFTHIEMVSDEQHWRNWALETDSIDPQVIGYVQAFPQYLFEFSAGSASKSFATPRSWHTASDILREDQEEPFSPEVLHALIAGAVGDGRAADFMEYRKWADEMPDTNDILSGKIKKLPKQPKTAVCYMLVVTMCHRLKTEVRVHEQKHGSVAALKKTKEYAEWLQRADNMLNFLLSDSIPPEICVMGVKTALNGYRLPFDHVKMAGFKEFTNRFSKHMVVKQGES